MGVSTSAFLFLSSIVFGTIFYKIVEPCNCSYGTTAVDGCDAQDFESCIHTGGFVKTWVNSFYMSVITVTTVGFGDYSPKSKLGRNVAILWMLYGFMTWARFLNAMTELFFEQSVTEGFKHTEEFDEEK